MKKKTEVRLRDGNTRKISKLVTVLKCLECNKGVADVDTERLKPLPSFKGGEGLKQLKIGSFFEKVSRASTLERSCGPDKPGISVLATSTEHSLDEMT